MWRAYAAYQRRRGQPARGMPGAQVAAVDYAPEGWPPGTYTVIRRVRVDADDISAGVRSRRRRTIPKDQLALALGGECDHAFAVSFIVTNLPANDGPDIVAVEALPKLLGDLRRGIEGAPHGRQLLSMAYPLELGPLLLGHVLDHELRTPRQGWARRSASSGGSTCTCGSCGCSTVPTRAA